MNRRSFMGLFGAVTGTAIVASPVVAGDAFANPTITKQFVDSYRSPIFTQIGYSEPKDYGPVTEDSVRAELADRHHIAIPSSKSLLRTPELTVKREILMKLVYTGQISIDMCIANPRDETSETCLIFYNSKPNV